MPPSKNGEIPAPTPAPAATPPAPAVPVHLRPLPDGRIPMTGMTQEELRGFVYGPEAGPMLGTACPQCGKDHPAPVGGVHCGAYRPNAPPEAPAGQTFHCATCGRIHAGPECRRTMESY